LAHALGELSAENVDEMRDAEALSGAEDGRERLLRGDEAIPDMGRFQAIVTVAAGRMIALAEISQEHLAAASGGLAITQQRLQLVALDAALALLEIGPLEERQERRHILHAIGHPGIGGKTVAAGAARLLIVGFEALGRVEMGDEADVGLVDA